MLGVRFETLIDRCGDFYTIKGDRGHMLGVLWPLLYVLPLEM